MAGVKKSETGEKRILSGLDHELNDMIEELAGTEMDYDPAIEAVSIEAILNSDLDED